MPVLALSADPETRAMLEQLLAIALSGQHIVWVDGQRDPDERTIQSAIPPRRAAGPGRPPPKPARIVPEQRSDVSLAFWHQGERLELDVATADLVRRAVAERTALMLISASEPALACLQLVHSGIDWEQVVSDGVEVIKTGESEGNRIKLQI